MDRLYFVVHTHWDREWYQPFQQMRARLVAMADAMLPEVESGAIPHFHFDGQTIVLEDYLEMRPQNARRIAKLVRSGKIAVGPWYVLADSFLVSGESLIRNLEFGIEMARRFGGALQLGYLPDQFGHAAQMPQILAGFGFKTALVWRGVGGDISRNRFIWEALDGSRIMTVYLPHSYANGSNLALGSIESFRGRIDEIAAREREFAADAPILVMNGNDHAHPDARLVTRIAEAGQTDAPVMEVGSLAGYARRISELPSDDATLHRGELRSSMRTHLLPGVTSARTWIKQRDFANSAALERYAGPLAALAHASGRGEGLAGFLELGWKTELQNHPHDSICGCSVDQVHRDMRYRFDQAAMLAETVVCEASKALLAPANAGETVLAVFNPGFSRQGLVSGSVELDDPHAYRALIGADGRRVPAAIEAASSRLVFEIEISAAELKSLISNSASASLMGYDVKSHALRKRDETAYDLELFLSRTPADPADVERARRELLSALPDSAMVRIRARDVARCMVNFVADDLTQTGFSFYRLVGDNSAEATAATPEGGAAATEPRSATIENEFYRLSATGRGLEISDLETGETLELYFEDDADRGDEYNYDPVEKASIISEPLRLSAHVAEDGPAHKRLDVAMALAVPDGLSGDRRSRSQHIVELPIELSASLYAGLKRVEFVSTVHNCARDHRLRVALRTPARVCEALYDTAFGVVHRPLDAVEARGTEAFYPAAPHRTVTAVEGATVSAAIMSRGLYEVEPRRESDGSTLLLTLLRCVGWLSRSDLSTRDGGAGPELETPGAQEQGTRRFEFAVTTYVGDYLEARLMTRVSNYAFPPRPFAAGATPSSANPPWLVRCDNPRVAFSTARPIGREHTWMVRVYSVSPEHETARLEFGDGTTTRLVDLAGRAQRRPGIRRRRAGEIEITLRPFEIATFRVERKKNFPSEAFK